MVYVLSLSIPSWCFSIHSCNNPAKDESPRCPLIPSAVRISDRYMIWNNISPRHHMSNSKPYELLSLSAISGGSISFWNHDGKLNRFLFKDLYVLLPWFNTAFSN